MKDHKKWCYTGSRIWS